ncbi:MAG: DUF1801 domain-containing protein [Pseudomonadales bacterium]
MDPQPCSDVERVFLSYPEGIRHRLYHLRALIFETASSIETVGPITETLKWGEPAYLTEHSRSGSTIRLGWKAATPSRYRIYFNCQTTLVDTFRTLFPDLEFEGNRALTFDEDQHAPDEPVRRCLELALTYHVGTKQARR